VRRHFIFLTNGAQSDEISWFLRNKELSTTWNVLLPRSVLIAPRYALSAARYYQQPPVRPSSQCLYPSLAHTECQGMSARHTIITAQNTAKTNWKQTWDVWGSHSGLLRRDVPSFLDPEHGGTTIFGNVRNNSPNVPVSSRKTWIFWKQTFVYEGPFRTARNF
jgi:hypothetical protein